MTVPQRARRAWASRTGPTLALLLAAAALSATGCAPSRAGAAVRPAAGQGCPAGTVRTTIVPDPAGGEREVWEYRPPVPDSASVPVVYLLHGLPGGAEDFGNAGLAGDLDALGCRTGVRVAVAAPDGTYDDVDTEWADDAGGAFRVESFVTGPLIAAVEGDRRRPRSLRAVGGFSMGGYGAATLALRHPDLYSQVASFAGYFHPDDPEGVLDDPAAHDPGQLVRSGVGAGLRFFLAVGDADDEPLVAGEAQRFAHVLTLAHVPVQVATAHGGHDLQTARSLLPAGLAFLAAGWR